MPSERVFLPRCFAKSVTVIIPTSLLSFITARRRIPLLTILLAASLIGASGRVTLRGVLITSETLVLVDFPTASTLLTKSLSVTIPTGTLFSITTKSPTSFCDIRAAASITVLLASMASNALSDTCTDAIGILHYYEQKGLVSYLEKQNSKEREKNAESTLPSREV